MRNARIAHAVCEHCLPGAWGRGMGSVHALRAHCARIARPLHEHRTGNTQHLARALRAHCGRIARASRYNAYVGVCPLAFRYARAHARVSTHSCKRVASMHVFRCVAVARHSSVHYRARACIAWRQHSRGVWYCAYRALHPLCLTRATALRHMHVRGLPSSTQRMVLLSRGLWCAIRTKQACVASRV